MAEVQIDGESCELRESDWSIYLGVNKWYRALYTGYYEFWQETDFTGRAYMTPGMSYETQVLLNGEKPTQPSWLNLLQNTLFGLIGNAN